MQGRQHRAAVLRRGEIAEALRPLDGSASCDALTLRANGTARMILAR